MLEEKASGQAKIVLEKQVVYRTLAYKRGPTPLPSGLGARTSGPGARRLGPESYSNKAGSNQLAGVMFGGSLSAHDGHPSPLVTVL